MSNLFSTINKNSVRTWNNMVTNATSESPNVDLFYKWGAARGKFETVIGDLSAALGENKDLAIRTLLWGRDVRQGAGERELFREAIRFMASNQLLTIEEARRLMVCVPKLGRWDDLFVFVETVLEDEVFSILSNAIFIENNGLAAKWTPRKGPIANKFRKFLNLSPKEYRKVLVTHTQVVENLMCQKKWDSINFSSVPSVASARYQNAFLRNAPVEYAAYRAALEKKTDPKVKINAGAVYPYDVIKSLRNGDVTIANAQWESLPNFMEGSESRGIMPVVDVSGSMASYDINGKYIPGYETNNFITLLDVAISLGLYLSERNRGIFKDEFITFSENPTIEKLYGNLNQRYMQLKQANWGGSTNLHAVFDLILKSAVMGNLSQEDMPSTILIISDMQFNDCTFWGDSAHNMITRKYSEANYDIPNLVFWNLNSVGAGVPVTHDTYGTALVSGCSPSIMKTIIKADDLTPKSMMLSTLMNPRYNW